MISVIIPLYNKANSVKESIRSVLAQTYQDYEIIVVDDGSTDDSVAVIETIYNPRIRIIRQANAGVSAARNRGIAEAKGEYVAFLDADDLWKPEFLSTMMSLVDKYPQCDVFAVNYEMQDTDGNVKNTIINKLPFDTEDGELTNYFVVASCSDPPICSISLMISKNAIELISGFPTGIKSGEDLITWTRLACKYRIAYSTKILAIYNQGLSIPRPPEPIDFVGEIMENLIVENSDKEGLGLYAAFWYKMRMCRCLANRNWRNAFIAFFKSLKYNWHQIKIYVSIVKYSIKGLL